jgi:integrase
MNMGGPEIQAFMSYLVNERHIAGATYTQALCALLFLYKKVLKIDLPWIDGISRPRKPAKRPTVLTRQEVALIFAQMAGVYGLIARLLYGTGMRLMECMQLRVKDVDFQRREIVVRQGKGGKDRVTVLPLALVVPLCEQLAQAKQLYENDRLNKRHGVMLPGALERKYPAAGTQWG